MGRRTYTSLKQFLKATGTNQEEFGKRVGLSQSQVSKIANGKLTPPLNLALEIAAEARIPVESLLRAS